MPRRFWMRVCCPGAAEPVQSEVMQSALIWIITGEASGDCYGANLAIALRQRNPQLRIAGMGSEQMRQAGVELMVDSTELGVVGIVEVLKHFPLFHQLFHMLLRRAAEQRPAAVVLIDYPGFNIRLAKRLRRLGITVIYYVSPQVWAWGKRRIPAIARDVNKMLVIFPFEAQVYAATSLDVEFVGHPLLEILNKQRDVNARRDPNSVLLLPGSRTHEVATLLPIMLQTIIELQKRQPQLRYILATPRQVVADQVAALIAQFTAQYPQLPAIELVVADTINCMQRAGVGLAASGTVTVEAAILGLPLVVGYRLNSITYQLARRLVNIPFFTMVNLVAGQCVFEEFLQDACNPPNLAGALDAILPGGQRYDEVHQRMQRAVAALGGSHDASGAAADAVLNCIRSQTAAD